MPLEALTIPFRWRAHTLLPFVPTPGISIRGALIRLPEIAAIFAGFGSVSPAGNSTPGACGSHLSFTRWPGTERIPRINHFCLLLPRLRDHLNFELFLRFSNRSNGSAGAGAKSKIQTWRWLEAPTHEAVHQYRKDDERNHDVKPVTLHGESSNREGNARHGSCD